MKMLNYANAVNAAFQTWKADQSEVNKNVLISSVLTGAPAIHARRARAVAYEINETDVYDTHRILTSNAQAIGFDLNTLSGGVTPE
jgi:hypothetical protein